MFANQNPTPDGIPYDPVQGLPPRPDPAATTVPGRGVSFPTTAPQLFARGANAYAAEAAAPVSPDQTQSSSSAGEIVSRYMDAADIYGIPDLPAAEPVEQTFILNGVPLRMIIATDAMTDAEKFYELSLLMQGKRNKDGSPAPQTLTVQPPNGLRFTLTNPLYIASLNLLSATVAQPRMSPEEWAILGKKVGAKGRQKGWHGLDDVAELAGKANGMRGEDVAEDEKGGAEDADPADSNTV